MPDDGGPIRPDDITDEEWSAAEGDGDDLTLCLAAQNAVRDRRVRADERERLAKRLMDDADEAGSNPVASPEFVRGLRWAAAAIREGGQQ